tara:strand:- start:467 stop:1330 length:864 start_codon:yes stop_codon:yes gene_type:complete
MPELPEVEVVKLSLKNSIQSKKINKVIVFNRNLRFKIHKKFESFLKKKIIINIQRFSKYILFYLDNKSILVLHLGMSGTIHILKNNRKNNFTNSSFYSSPLLPKKHNHVIIFFDKLKIIYNDPRRFGFFKIVKNNEELEHFFKNYGLEPFDKKFNLQYLKKSLRNKTKNIKNYLLDQKFISGIGNIYANEILYFCRINPFKQSGRLSNKDHNNIIFYSRKVLKNAIKKGGSSIQNFTNTQGNKGNFQDNFRVYQRDKLKCLRKDCEGKIDKKIISNRSTFYCNSCQK